MFIGNRRSRLTAKTVLGNRQGSMLVYLVLVIVVLGLLGAVMLSLYNVATLSSSMPNAAIDARYMAESGIRYALSELRNAAPANKAATRVTLLAEASNPYTPAAGGGSFRISNIVSTPPKVIITVTGLAQNGTTSRKLVLGPLDVGMP